MRSNYRKLGAYIQQVDIRNSEGKEENLLGVTTQKYFFPSIANTIGTDFTNYKVVKRNQFTYVSDTSRRGDRIGIALLDNYDEGLVSNIYTVFEVKDIKKLLPEYLMMWFRRPEFDRYARFKSHGSVREIFDWEEMCNVELPVPDIEKQKAIVKEYKTIEGRIRLKKQINDNLEDSLLYQSRHKKLLQYLQSVLFIYVCLYHFKVCLSKFDKFIKQFVAWSIYLIKKYMVFITSRHFCSCRARHNIVKKGILGQSTIQPLSKTHFFRSNNQNICVTTTMTVTKENLFEIRTDIPYKNITGCKSYYRYVSLTSGEV